MKLIYLLVKELPRRGGWPIKVTSIGQDYDRELMFYGIGKPRTGIILDDLAVDHRKCGDSDKGVTRAQYESALAASEGWIEWGGGECPVDEGSIVDLKDRDGYLWLGAEALLSTEAKAEFWRHTGVRVKSNDIIAYRLHKPGINSRANDDRLEQDLNECIGASEAQLWNGDGVPPIGCACEMQDSKGTWLPVDIIAKNDGFTFGWSYDYRIVLFGDGPDEFRPLRTESEKARDGFVKLVMGWMHHAGEAEIALIYDAIASGKIPGVKLENK